MTTLTKKMSEDLSQYLLEMGFKTRYLHSEIDTLERIQIIRDLRLGEYDVLVGVNLLREGLDLPEVSLVAILDADKEGFLRGETSLIQTIGRAARNVDGTVLMYADKETRAMRAAISETDRRREIQLAYNERHGITAATIVKGISDIAEFLQAESKVPRGRKRRTGRAGRRRRREMPRHELERMVVELEEEMIAAAEELRFEYAAQLRDELRELRRDLREIRCTLARLRSAADESPRIRRRGPRPAGHRTTGLPDRPARVRHRAVDAHLRALAAEFEELQRASAGGGASPRWLRRRPPRCRASSRRPRRRRRTSSARRSEARPRRARRPTGTPSGPARTPSSRARAHVAAVAQATAVLLERVGAMDAEVSALVESLRAGAGPAGAATWRRSRRAWASSTTPPPGRAAAELRAQEPSLPPRAPRPARTAEPAAARRAPAPAAAAAPPPGARHVRPLRPSPCRLRRPTPLPPRRTPAHRRPPAQTATSTAPAWSR